MSDFPAIITGGGEKFFCAGWDLKAAAGGEEVDGDVLAFARPTSTNRCDVALGATRMQIVTQNLVEVGLVGGVGGLLGIGLCYAGLAWLQSALTRAPAAMFSMAKEWPGTLSNSTSRLMSMNTEPPMV